MMLPQGNWEQNASAPRHSRTSDIRQQGIQLKSRGEVSLEQVERELSGHHSDHTIMGELASVFSAMLMKAAHTLIESVAESLSQPSGRQVPGSNPHHESP